MVFNDVFILFMDHSELSIKLFRLLMDISQEILKGHFTSVQFFFFITIYHDGRASVWFSSFSVFRFLPLMGLATRARNIIWSGYHSWWVFSSAQSDQIRSISISLFRGSSYQVVSLIDWFSQSSWLSQSNHLIKAVSQLVSQLVQFNSVEGICLRYVDDQVDQHWPRTEER